MKRKAITALLLAVIMALLTAFSGCSLNEKIPFLNKVPQQYTEGIKYDKDFPDDELEIYDDAIVFEEVSYFGEIILLCGTTDDIDDIVSFYKDFFEDNEIELIEETQDRKEYYASYQSGGYSLKLEVLEAEGEYIEDEFEYVIHLYAKEMDDNALAAVATAPPSTLAPESTPTPEISSAHTQEPTAAPTVAPEPTPIAYNDAVEYFLEIAIWEGYGLVMRWETPINVQIGGNYTDEDYNNIIDHLDIFNAMGCFPPISVVESDANMLIYFLPREEVTEYVYNYDGETLSCHHILVNDDSQFEKITGVVVTDFITQEEKKFASLGVLAQGLGLFQYSNKYSDSIFYFESKYDWTGVQEYSEMDYAIMRILYSDAISTGMDAETARAALMP